MALTLQDLEKQIAQLKVENAKLQQQSSNGKAFAVETGEFKGAPTLSFSGSFKPWRKGARSIAALFEIADKVRAALKECGISV